MTDLSVSQQLVPYNAKPKIRFVTAASLLEGHDAPIHINSCPRPEAEQIRPQRCSRMI